MLDKYKKLFIKHASGPHGEVWLGMLSATESIFLPVPTDTLMMGMLLLGDNRKKWIRIATITMVASVVGAIMGYFIAWFFGSWLFGVMHIGAEFGRIREFLDHGIFVFTIIGAVSPIPYKLFVLTAGFIKANFIIFLIASIIGRSLRLYASAWLVYKYGEHGVRVARRYGIHIIFISLAVCTIYILGYMYM